MVKKYWLFKSEPNVFSINDLESSKNQTTYWDGVRNYQARNFLRDEIKLGDGVLFYHSNTNPIGIYGIAKVVKEGYPDYNAWEPSSNYYDPKSTSEKPTWFMVDIKLVKKIEHPITLEQLKKTPGLKNMKVVQRGMRLSIQPVTDKEWQIILNMA